MSFLLCYKPYMKNYNTALIAMCHLAEKRPAFKEIKEVKTTQGEDRIHMYYEFCHVYLMICKCIFQTFEDMENLTLESFLITPIQRIPRYLLLLRVILLYIDIYTYVICIDSYSSCHVLGTEQIQHQGTQGLPSVGESTLDHIHLHGNLEQRHR